MTVEENSAASNWIAFDRVEIDLAGRRLFVDSVAISLEPKAFDVLALLAQAPGKAFTRDDILDAVWGHRHVTPSVLTRAVTLIRQALGDGAYVLHTLHGVGYRFDGEIRRLARRGAEIDDAALASGDPQRGTDLPTAPLAPQTMPRSPSPHRRWVLAAGLAVLAACALLWAERQRATPSLSPTLVVLPLRAIGDAKGEDAFAGGLSEELITRLAQIDGLRVISSTSAERAQKDDFDPSQLAAKLHTTHALEGSLRGTGDKLRIDLRLFETPSGRTLWSQEYDRRENDVFRVQEEIAQAVASALALHIKLARSASPPPDPEVFREYLELRHIFSSRPASESPKAEAALEALAARAPDFAPVHALLAGTLASHYEPGREQQALPEAMLALKLDPNSVYAHVALGELACLRKAWDDCMKELRTALALNPSDPIVNIDIGGRLSGLGYSTQALERFRIAHATDPLSYWTNLHVGVELEILGRAEEARPYLDVLRNLDPSSPQTCGILWYNAVLRNDLSAARAIAAQMPDDYPWKASFLAVSEALTNPTAWPDTMKTLQAAQEKTGQWHWLMALAQKPDAATALHVYENIHRLETKFIWSRAFTAIRHDPAFSDFLRRTKMIDYWNAHGWPPQCKPDGDGAKCD